MRLELSGDEVRLLQRLLDRYRGDLSMEVADTDNSRFKTDLRQEQEILAGVIEKVKGAGVE